MVVKKPSLGKGRPLVLSHTILLFVISINHSHKCLQGQRHALAPYDAGCEVSAPCRSDWMYLGAPEVAIWVCSS